MTKQDTRFKPGVSGNNTANWKPGQSGNPAGKSKRRMQFEEALNEAQLCCHRYQQCRAGTESEPNDGDTDSITGLGYHRYTGQSDEQQHVLHYDLATSSPSGANAVGQPVKISVVYPFDSATSMFWPGTRPIGPLGRIYMPTSSTDLIQF
jgi:hypothetical protein